MTVAVSCNLAEGVVLGVDSAVTLVVNGGVQKVYENADKIFQIGASRIGAAVYGMASLGDRSIGSFFREFANQNGDFLNRGNHTVQQVADSLRAFLCDNYMRLVAPGVEAERKQDFDKIPIESLPALGVVVAGFSTSALQSEVFNIFIPRDKAVTDSQRVRAVGDYGFNWFSGGEPISRYVKGYDPELVGALLAEIHRMKKVDFTSEDFKSLAGFLGKYEFRIPIGIMPLHEGVAFVRFLVNLVISHHRFAIGAPVVGGRARIGLVSYDDKPFSIMDLE